MSEWEVGTFRKHPHGDAVVRGHVDALQVDPARLPRRHFEAVVAMRHRGMNHASPLGRVDVDAWPNGPAYDRAEVGAANRETLAERCEDCAARMGSQMEDLGE